MAYLTRYSCIETLQCLFIDPAINTLTLDEIYVAAGRDLSTPKQNLKWLQNTSVSLKHYGLVRVSYTTTYPRRLSKVHLTTEGKNALVRPAPVSPRTITLESILHDITIFARQTPSMECTLVVTVRRQESTRRPTSSHL